MSESARMVAYYRVSTARQGTSGLGLEAQRAAVSRLVAQRGGELVAEFTEVESGKDDARPKLAAALNLVQVTGATLVIAKLDRLSRNLTFLSKLQDSGVPFIAADTPEANDTTVQLLAVLAQHERKAISQRTKEALAAAKRRGAKLGNPKGAEVLKGQAEKGATASAAVRSNAAQAYADQLRPIIEGLREAGHTSLGALARELTAMGARTPRGGKWHKATVAAVLKRLS